MVKEYDWQQVKLLTTEENRNFKLYLTLVLKVLSYLFVWFEWLAKFEIKNKIGETFDVGYTRGIMVRVVPRPRTYTIVVVVEVPLYGRDVAFGL